MGMMAESMVQHKHCARGREYEARDGDDGRIHGAAQAPCKGKGYKARGGDDGRIHGAAQAPCKDEDHEAYHADDAYEIPSVLPWCAKRGMVSTGEGGGGMSDTFSVQV
jgi:hypothetical protein